MFGTCSPLTFIVILQRFQMALIRSASQKGLTMLDIGCQENSPWKFPYAEEVNTCYIPDASLCFMTSSSASHKRRSPHGLLTTMAVTRDGSVDRGPTLISHELRSSYRTTQ